MAVVNIPPPYRGPTHGEGSIPVDGSTVKQCLDALESRYPGFAAQVFKPDGTLHKFVKLFVNSEQIDSDDLDHPLDSEDELEILAAIAGG